MSTQSEDVSSEIHSEGESNNFNWTTLHVKGYAFETHSFRSQNFLDLSVLKSHFLRDTDLRVLTKDSIDSVRIVKDIQADNTFILDSEEVKNIKDVILYQDEACRLNPTRNMDGIVFIGKQFIKKKNMEVRTLIKEGQYFVYHPPGNTQSFAVVIRNQFSVLECLLFPGELTEDKTTFNFFSGDPTRTVLIMGSIGMHPLYERFELDKSTKSMILGNVSKQYTETNITKSPSKLSIMPECLFRVPVIEGNLEIEEEQTIELLNVVRDPSFPHRYSPAEPPSFFLATIISMDELTVTVRVTDGDDVSIYCVDISEGLLYPIGTAVKLGVTLRGEETGNEHGVEDVGGPKKYEGKEWRGFAEYLIDDSDDVFIRPIIIRNIHFGIVAEFSFLDDMESGSVLLPLSNPHLLPFEFSKRSKIPFKFNYENINRQMIEQVWNEERRNGIFTLNPSMDHIESMGDNQSSVGNGDDVPNSSSIDYHMGYIDELEEEIVEEVVNEDMLLIDHVENENDSDAPVYVSMEKQLMDECLRSSTHSIEDYTTEDMMDTNEMEDNTQLREDSLSDSILNGTGIDENNGVQLEEMIEYKTLEDETELKLSLNRGVWTTESTPSVIRKEIELDDNILESINDDIKQTLSTSPINDGSLNESMNKVNSLYPSLVESTDTLNVVAVEVKDNNNISELLNPSEINEEIDEKKEEEENDTIIKEGEEEVEEEEKIEEEDETVDEEKNEEEEKVEGKEEEKVEKETDGGEEEEAMVEEEKEKVEEEEVQKEKNDEEQNVGKEEDTTKMDEEVEEVIRKAEEEEEMEDEVEKDEIKGEEEEESDREDMSEDQLSSSDDSITDMDDEDIDVVEMLSEGIQPCSSSNISQSIVKEVEASEKEAEQILSFDSNQDVPCKKVKLNSPMDNEHEKSNRRSPLATGVPLDPSFNPFELPRAQVRAMESREAGRVRGGFPRSPFIRSSPAENIDYTGIISGEEEGHRIKMERILKQHHLFKISDKITDVAGTIKPDLMTKFRNPLEWNSLEVQLFLDQFDLHEMIKDYVAQQDFDGMKLLSLTSNEVFKEIPIVIDDATDFNEKVIFNDFINRIKKIAKDPSNQFAPS